MINGKLAVKRNLDIDAFYKLEEDGNWEEMPRLMDRYLDGDYIFEEITEEEAFEFYKRRYNLEFNENLLL